MYDTSIHINSVFTVHLFTAINTYLILVPGMIRSMYIAASTAEKQERYNSSIPHIAVFVVFRFKPLCLLNCISHQYSCTPSVRLELHPMNREISIMCSQTVRHGTKNNRKRIKRYSYVKQV